MSIPDTPTPPTLEDLKAQLERSVSELQSDIDKKRSAKTGHLKAARTKTGAFSERIRKNANDVGASQLRQLAKALVAFDEDDTQLENELQSLQRDMKDQKNQIDHLREVGRVDETATDADHTDGD